MSHDDERGLRLVRNADSSPTFRVGETIPVSGVYRAVHGDHRLAHLVTLLSGQAFPHCKKCLSIVHFELIAEAPASFDDKDFHIRLYEIPHPADAVEEVDSQNVA